MAEINTKAVTSARIALRGRGSFLKLAQAKPFEEGQKPRYEATSLLDPASKEGLESIKLLLNTAAAISKEKWGFVPLAIKKLGAAFIPGQTPPDLNKIKDDGVELAFYDGTIKADSREDDTYEACRGMLVVPSHEYVDRPKPKIVNRKREPVEQGEEQWPYSGCYIVHYVTLWTQSNLKKRIGVNLKGVQFDRDGDAFGSGAEMSEDDFEALEDAAAATDTSDWD